MKFRTIVNGETRLVRRFAFLPVRCDDGMTVWLSWYWRKDRYGTRKYNNEGGFIYTWIACEWYSERPKENA